MAKINTEPALATLHVHLGLRRFPSACSEGQSLSHEIRTSLHHDFIQIHVLAMLLDVMRLTELRWIAIYQPYWVLYER